MTRRRPLSIATALGLCLVWGPIAGCDDSTPNHDYPPPGLVILTPRVGGASGGLASVLVRSDQPARISIAADEDVDAVPLGTGRSGRDATAIRFSVPAEVGGGTTVLTVTAVSEGGMSESDRVTLEGLGDLELLPTVATFLDVAALPSRAVVSAQSTLYVVARGSAEPFPSTEVDGVQAIAADEPNEAVLVSDGAATISSYRVSEAGALDLDDQFEFAAYDSSLPQAVDHVTALHVNGALVAAATSKGMSIMDRAAVGAEGEVFCRTRSAMTATLKQAVFDPAMAAAVVTADERVVAGASYLNIYEPGESGDDGGCDPAMPGRGTSVIAAPEGATLAWGIVATAVTESYIWIGRADEGVIRLPHAFALNDTNRYFREDDLWVLGSDELPLPVVVDVAPWIRDALWVVVADADGVRSGLARIGAAGVDLWVDAATVGGAPRAIDSATLSTDLGELWVLSDAGVAAFTTP